MSKTFQFTAPDGKTYEVTAPDSATQEQAFAVLRTQLAKPKPEPEVGLGQKVQDFGVGMLSGAARIGRGIASAPKLIGLPPIGGQGWIDESKQAWEGVMKGNTLAGEDTGRRSRGFAGSAGEFTAELAGTAGAPGGALRHLPRALSLLKGPAGRAALEGAAAGVLTGEGEWKDVGIGAGGGLAGNTIIRGGGRLLQGAKQTPQANELRAMGIDVTAGQGSKGVVHALEEASQYLPVAANAVRRQREIPYGQFREKVARSAQPEEFPFTANSRRTALQGENMDEILANTRRAIESRIKGTVAGKVFKEDATFQKDVNNMFLRPHTTMGDAELGRAVRDINDKLNPGRRSGWRGDELMVVRDNLLRSADSSNNPEVAKIYKYVASKINYMMARQSPEVGLMERSMAVPRANLETAERAAKGAVSQGEFGVAQLANAADQTGNTYLKNLGRKAATVLKDDLNKGGTGVRTAIGVGSLAAGSYLGGPWGAGTTAAIPAALYLGLGTRRGQKFMSGQLKSQKRLAEFLRKHPSIGSTTGALTAGELGE